MWTCHVIYISCLSRLSSTTAAARKTPPLRQQQRLPLEIMAARLHSFSRVSAARLPCAVPDLDPPSGAAAAAEAGRRGNVGRRRVDGRPRRPQCSGGGGGMTS